MFLPGAVATLPGNAFTAVEDEGGDGHGGGILVIASICVAIVVCMTLCFSFFTFDGE
jgi:hypothetical protein